MAEIATPIPKDDEVLIRVRAVSVNASDWETLRGKPLYARIGGLFKPKNPILGSDIAGVVDAVGKEVRRFRPGDEVFGDILSRGGGGFAQYVCAPQQALIHKPAGIDFATASTLPQAATLALQGLRDAGGIQSGQRVLINGAGGCGGTFAIQLAKRFGAQVTAVDKAKKLTMMRSIGADRVIDYMQPRWTAAETGYALILDFVGGHSIFTYRRMLHPTGAYVVVGGSMMAILSPLIVGSLLSLFGKRRMGVLAHRPNTDDLSFLADLTAAGEITPVIDSRYPLSKVADALRRQGAGDINGKIVITVADDSDG